MFFLLCFFLKNQVSSDTEGGDDMTQAEIVTLAETTNSNDENDIDEETM